MPPGVAASPLDVAPLPLQVAVVPLDVATSPLKVARLRRVGAACRLAVAGSPHPAFATGVRAFHGTASAPAPVPLDVLETNVHRWIDEQKARVA